jgi:hypothetical protein
MLIGRSILGIGRFHFLKRVGIATFGKIFIMKKTIILLSAACTAMAAFSQRKFQIPRAGKPEIVVLGTAHQYDMREPLDLTLVEKIKKWGPDIICGEYLSPKEQKETKDYYAKDYIMELVADARKAKDIPAGQMDDYIKTQRAKLQKNPDDHLARIQLCHAYFLNADIFNGRYQHYLLYKMNKEAGFTEQEHAELNRLLTPLDSVDYDGWNIKNEYLAICFPMARQLKQSLLYPVDCQRYDGQWSPAWHTFDSLAEVYFENLQQLKIYDDRYWSTANWINSDKLYDSLYKKVKKEGKLLYMLNSKIYGDMDEWGNIGNFDLCGLPGFPCRELKEKYKWWNMRTKGIYNNILQAAKESGARRIFVILGASHIKDLRKEIEKDGKITFISPLEL